jgi:cytidine deaminase
MQNDLLAAALQARERAYVPYSHFKVGAAVYTQQGKIFSGGNIENISYGLCNCAERTALFSAIAAGTKPRDFLGMAVIAEGDTPVAPCGACRQVMYELLGPETLVWLGNVKGEVRQTTVGALLPDAFDHFVNDSTSQ